MAALKFLCPETGNVVDTEIDLMRRASPDCRARILGWLARIASSRTFWRAYPRRWANSNSNMSDGVRRSPALGFVGAGLGFELVLIWLSGRRAVTRRISTALA